MTITTGQQEGTLTVSDVNGDSLQEFLTGNNRNEWISSGLLNIYVRKGRHIIQSKMAETIDVANVQIHTNKERGKGRFTTWLHHAEREADQRGWYVRVECILNRRLVHYLERRGYIVISDTGIGFGRSVTMYRELNGK